MLKTIFSVCSMLRLNPVLSIPTQECTCQIVSSFLKQNQSLKGHLFPSFISPDFILTQDIPLGLEVSRACFVIIPIGGHVANCFVLENFTTVMYGSYLPNLVKLLYRASFNGFQLFSNLGLVVLQGKKR
jgi:hypothetical protein